MSDQIGRIEVPTTAAVGTFPLLTDWSYGCVEDRNTVVHQFGSANAKIEQRFYVGKPARRFFFRRSSMAEPSRKALRDFWESHHGPDIPFTYNAPNQDGTTTAVKVRFAAEPLSLEYLQDQICSTGITFVEVVDPNDAPVYSITSTVERFPTTALNTALLSQVQEIIPLLRIRVLEEDVPDILVSDRRVTVGSNLYLPRITDIGKEGSEVLISQSINGESDGVQFSLGNADRVMSQLVQDTDLMYATVEFSLFHVGTHTKIDLWAGYLMDWSIDQGPICTITCKDILAALTRMVPSRRTSRTGWKPFNSAEHGCPYSTQGSGGDPAKCDHNYQTDNGCVAHGMKRYFCGIYAEPQGTLIKLNSTGAWGWGRKMVSATSQVSETMYNQGLAEIWHDDEGAANQGMPVNCLIAAGRSEGDFYDALGIVGRGPIGAFTDPHMYEQSDGSKVMIAHTLDGSPHHGFRTDGTGNNLGLRTVVGDDPAGLHDYFSLGRVGTSAGEGEVAHEGSVYRDIYAAGVAFAELRISIPKGSEPSSITEHQMKVWVAKGLSGWTWSSPGVRTLSPGLTNPIWVAINTFLSGLGIWNASASFQERFFDVQSAISLSAIADDDVAKIFGTGTEKQFRFKGVVSDPNALSKWLQDILNCALGYYTWSFGKLKVGCRYSASAPHAFTSGNTLFGSLRVAPLKPEFERLVVEFADQEYGYQKNAVEYHDEDHSSRKGRAGNPLTSTILLAGVNTKSQGGRLATIRTREELGGSTAEEQTQAREVSLRTTILALEVDAGAVCSCSTGMPDFQGKFRVTSWRLNRDWSIDISGRSVTDSMYDLTTGPKPADVAAAPVPEEPERDWNLPTDPTFDVAISSIDPTVVEVSNLEFPSLDNTHTIGAGTFEVFYVDEAAAAATLSAGINASVASVALSSAAGITAGDYLLIDGELVLCGTPSGSSVPITRGQLGTAAASHTSGASARKAQRLVKSELWPYNFFSGDGAADWKLSVSLPDRKVAAVTCYVSNAYGDSDVVEVGTTGNADKGLRLTTPTYEPSPYPDAPNITSATCSVFYETIGGRLHFGFAGTMTLPTADANYGHLIRVVITAKGPNSDTKELPVATHDSIDFTGSTLGYKSQLWPVDDSAGLWDLKFESKNENGKSTEPAYEILDKSVSPITVTSPAIAETGTRVLGDDQITRMTVRLSCSLSANPGALSISSWTSKDDGSTWQVERWEDRTGTSPVIDIEKMVTETTSTWKAAFVPRQCLLASPPADAVISGGTSIAGLELPPDNALTGIAVTDAYPVEDIEGNQSWWIDSLSWTASASVHSAWFTAWRTRFTDASGNPAPANRGGEWTPWNAHEKVFVPGEVTSWPIGNWGYQPEDAADYHYMEIEVAVSRREVAGVVDFALQRWPDASTRKRVDTLSGSTLPEGKQDARRIKRATLGPGLGFDAEGKPTTATDSPENLVNNPIFTYWDDGASVPRGWTLQTGSVTNGVIAYFGGQSVTFGSGTAVISSTKVVVAPGDQRYFRAFAALNTGSALSSYYWAIQGFGSDGGKVWDGPSLDLSPLVAGSGSHWLTGVTVTIPHAGEQGATADVVAVHLVFSTGLSAGVLWLQCVQMLRQAPTGAGLEPDGAGGSKAKLSGGVVTVDASNNLHLANYSLGEAFYASLSLSNRALADAAASTSKIQDLATVREKLANLAVDSAKMADLAATAAKLATGCVTAANGALSANSITAANGAIAAFAVGNLQVASAVIDNTKLTNLAVGWANIQNLAVLDQHIQNLAASKILAGTVAVQLWLTSPVIQIHGGTVWVDIDASNYVKVSNSGGSTFTQLTSAACIVYNPAGYQTDITTAGLHMASPATWAAVYHTQLILGGQQVVGARQSRPTDLAGVIAVLAAHGLTY